MKKVVLFFAIAIAAFSANAQKVKYGVKAGANLFYQLTGDDADDFEESRKMKLGVAGGAFANISLTEALSLQPELLYSTEGNLQKEGDMKQSINLGYINIPVMLQYNIASGFFAETGPQLGFLTSAKAKMDDGDDEETMDIKDDLKSINFSWALGVGYKMANGFGVGARYNLGLSSIADDDDTKIKSSGLNVSVFYTFGGKK